MERHSFNPILGLQAGYLQSFAGLYWPQMPEPKACATHTVDLSDGDKLGLVENRSKKWKSGSRVFVLIHGLSGCSKSRYIIRIARKLRDRGALVIRADMRNCGDALGLSRILITLNKAGAYD